jgi:hypothetical protein
VGKQRAVPECCSEPDAAAWRSLPQLNLESLVADDVDGAARKRVAEARRNAGISVEMDDLRQRGRFGRSLVHSANAEVSIGQIVTPQTRASERQQVSAPALDAVPLR